nr:DUF4422 domain-containing protein [Bacilli bacterium]
MKDIKIIIATHKKYEMPKDNMYLPLHVGAEGKQALGYVKDNTGDNISLKNPYFCELTGLYWAWKNLDNDYIGLAHYRRHFTDKLFRSKNTSKNIANAISKEKVDKLLDNADVILPKKRNYYIDNLYDHYKHTMYIEPLDETRKIIKEKYPKYLKEFDDLKKRTSAHMFNMFIMKKDILNDYSKWLFDILFELDKRIDDSKYDTFHARFYGRVSELLLDVYLRTNNIKYKEVRIVDIENINWFNKIKSFLKAKFKGDKYGKSF